MRARRQTPKPLAMRRFTGSLPPMAYIANDANARLAAEFMTLEACEDEIEAHLHAPPSPWRTLCLAELADVMDQALNNLAYWTSLAALEAVH